MEKYHGNTVEYWKQNAEENYSATPISVLKYITVLEEQAAKLQKLEESNKNGMHWFNSYQDVDDFLFNELDKKGLEFITDFEKPHLNTIASIELLIGT